MVNIVTRKWNKTKAKEKVNTGTAVKISTSFLPKLQQYLLFHPSLFHIRFDISSLKVAANSYKRYICTYEWTCSTLALRTVPCSTEIVERTVTSPSRRFSCSVHCYRSSHVWVIVTTAWFWWDAGTCWKFGKQDKALLLLLDVIQ
jgi:hypothetical protein